MNRTSREFHYKDAHFRIVTDAWQAVTESIVNERHRLEAFIGQYPQFGESLNPVPESEFLNMPESAVRMCAASRKTGLGPMAAVAGTMAQLAAERSAVEGSAQTIVENGGDIYLDCREEVTIGIYAGGDSPFRNLAFSISSEMMPLSLCSSSGRMGHSLSFGDCDVVTVFSKNASLADAAATLGCNLVRKKEDIEPVLNRIVSIEGILGAVIIRDDSFGSVGTIPDIIKSSDSAIRIKVSRDEKSDFT